MIYGYWYCLMTVTQKKTPVWLAYVAHVLNVPVLIVCALKCVCQCVYAFFRCASAMGSVLLSQQPCLQRQGLPVPAYLFTAYFAISTLVNGALKIEAGLAWCLTQAFGYLQKKKQQSRGFRPTRSSIESSPTICSCDCGAHICWKRCCCIWAVWFPEFPFPANIGLPAPNVGYPLRSTIGAIAGQQGHPPHPVLKSRALGWKYARGRPSQCVL